MVFRTLYNNSHDIILNSAIGLLKLLPAFKFFRWLVKKGRDHEALMVLYSINGKESFVATYLDLEELRKTINADLKNHIDCSYLLKEIFHVKYR